MNEAQVAKLLGRSLTSSEVTNFDTHIKIVYEWLKTLVCFTICDDGGERIYTSRKGYRSLYIDPCTAITSVVVDVTTRTDYVLRQNESYNGSWYNVIEFEEALNGEKVTVNASWGFDVIPYDLQLLIARLFEQVSAINSSNVETKEIEDFRVTFRDSSVFDSFVKDNQMVISKYSQCLGEISNGTVQYIC